MCRFSSDANLSVAVRASPLALLTSAFICSFVVVAVFLRLVFHSLNHLGMVLQTRWRPDYARAFVGYRSERDDFAQEFRLKLFGSGKSC